MAIATAHALQQEFCLQSLLDEDKFFQAHSREGSSKGQADHMPLMSTKVFVFPL